MKTLLIGLSLGLISISSQAQLNKIEVDITPKKAKLIQATNESVMGYLSYDDQYIMGGTYEEDISNHTITALYKDPQGSLKALDMETTVFAFYADHDFGDPVFEEETLCSTRITFNKKDISTKTTCDFDPHDEFPEWGYQD